jgi:hypothetical protein
MIFTKVIVGIKLSRISILDYKTRNNFFKIKDSKKIKFNEISVADIINEINPKARTIKGLWEVLKERVGPATLKMNPDLLIAHVEVPIGFNPKEDQ